MKFRHCMGPSHEMPSLPIRSFNSDGSIELYDGRKLDLTRDERIEYEHTGTECDTSRVICTPHLGDKYAIDVFPPAVRVRPLTGGFSQEYRFLGGNWYWMMPLGFKLTMLWHRYSPWSWTRRYGL
jgi:hypothetical protein